MTTDDYPFDPDWCMHPGTTLGDILHERQYSPARFSLYSGIQEPLLMGLLNCNPDVRINQRLAERITLGIERTGKAPPASFWMALEKNYRDGLAAGKTDASPRP